MKLMQSNKTKLVFALVAVIALAAIVRAVVVRTGRGTEKDAFWSEEWEDSLCDQTGDNYMENGVLHMVGSEHTNGTYLRFSNNATGKDDLICVDQNCSHEASKDSSCGAYISASVVGGVAIRGNHIFYIANTLDAYGKFSLYVANLEGKARKKMGALPKMDLICDVLYHKNMVYITYLSKLSEEQDDLAYGLYAFDLKTQKGKQFFQGQGNGAVADGIAMGDKWLYFSYGMSEATKDDILQHSEDAEYEKKHTKLCVKAIDPVSGKVQKELDGFGNDCVLLFAQGQLFYSKGEDLYAYSEQEDTSTKINEKGDLIALLSQNRKQIYFRGTAAEGNDLALVSYQSNNKEFKEQNVGSFFPVAVAGKYVYGFGESGDTAWILLDDLEQGNLSKVHDYQSQWDEN